MLDAKSAVTADDGSENRSEGSPPSPSTVVVSMALGAIAAKRLVSSSCKENRLASDSVVERAMLIKLQIKTIVRNWRLQRWRRSTKDIMFKEKPANRYGLREITSEKKK